MTQDPVSAKSTFLCMYMSSHPDTLVAYVKHYGKIAHRDVTGAEMAAIDTKSMTLNYKRKSGEKGTVVVPLNPPLSGYEEVKPRLLGMKAEAQEALGMIKAPRITSFYLPPLAWIPTGIPFVLLMYTTLALSSVYVNSPLFAPGRALAAAVGDWVMWGAWVLVGVTHPLEALYTLSLCKRHQTPFFVGVKWTLSTLALGFPTWIELRKQIQAARIESVMKVE